MIVRIFWRHGDALWGLDDLARPLSARGQQQALQSACFLKERLGAKVSIYASEARRAQETASFYGKPITLKGLNPDGAFSLVEESLLRITDDCAIIVGHLPWIGQVLGQYLQDARGYIALNTSEVYALAFVDGKWQLRFCFQP